MVKYQNLKKQSFFGPRNQMISEELKIFGFHKNNHRGDYFG